MAKRDFCKETIKIILIIQVHGNKKKMGNLTFLAPNIRHPSEYIEVKNNHDLINALWKLQNNYQEFYFKSIYIHYH